MNSLRKQRSTSNNTNLCKNGILNQPGIDGGDLQLSGRVINLSQRPGTGHGRASVRSMSVSGPTHRRPMSAIPAFHHQNELNASKSFAWRRPQSADQTLQSSKIAAKFPVKPYETNNQDTKRRPYSFARPLSISSLTDDTDDQSDAGDVTGIMGSTYTLPDMCERTWTEEELIRYCDEAESLHSDENSLGEQILAMAQTHQSKVNNLLYPDQTNNQPTTAGMICNQPITPGVASKPPLPNKNRLLFDSPGSTESVLSTRLQEAERETDLLLKQLADRDINNVLIEEHSPPSARLGAEGNEPRRKRPLHGEYTSRYIPPNSVGTLKRLEDTLDQELRDVARVSSRNYPSELSSRSSTGRSSRESDRSSGSITIQTSRSRSAEHSQSNENVKSIRSLGFDQDNGLSSDPVEINKRNGSLTLERSCEPRSSLVSRSTSSSETLKQLGKGTSCDKYRPSDKIDTFRFLGEPTVSRDSAEKPLDNSFMKPKGPRSVSSNRAVTKQAENTPIAEVDYARVLNESSRKQLADASSKLNSKQPVREKGNLVNYAKKLNASNVTKPVECNKSDTINNNRSVCESNNSTLRLDSHSSQTNHTDVLSDGFADDYTREEGEPSLTPPNKLTSQRPELETGNKAKCDQIPLIDFDEEPTNHHSTSSQSSNGEVCIFQATNGQTSLSQPTNQHAPSSQLVNHSVNIMDTMNPTMSVDIQSRCVAKDGGKSTYEDIVNILKVLEQDEAMSILQFESLTSSDCDLLDMQKLPSQRHGLPDDLFHDTTMQQLSARRLGPSDDLADILSYLDKVDRGCADPKPVGVQQAELSKLADHGGSDLAVKLEDLLSMNVVDLAHLVFTLRFQMADKSKSVKALKQALKEEREERQRCEEEGEKQLKDRLKEQKQHYETAVARHQAFIDQLISDKKALTDKVESVLSEMKSLEERHAKNLKVLQERHVVEVQRAKDAQAATNKLRMDSWVNTKTKKIKELTVKGLEPELVRMTTAHQQELAELRQLHQHELKEVELRAARKTETAMELLRQQLAQEKQEAVARERDLLKTRIEKQAEQEEMLYQEHRHRLLNEVKREKQRLEQELVDAREDNAKAVDRIKLDYQDKMEATNRRHQIELRKARQEVEAERETWAQDFRKQKEAELSERETQCREELKRERDKQIELVIEKLAEEATQAKAEMEQATALKMRKLKDKHDADLKDVEESEQSTKVKYNQMKNRLAEVEDSIAELRACNRQLEKQLQEEKKMTELFSTERSQLKEVLRQEFLSQLASLELELGKLRAELASNRARYEVELATLRTVKEHEMQAVCSRVKSTIAQRDATIEQLEIKCRQLQGLVEEQRKEYLLK